LEETAFYNNRLTEVVLGSGLETIGRLAFYDCRITTIIIPASVELIGDNVFHNNPITSLTILGDEFRFNETWGDTGLPTNLMPEDVN
jgi:hypothetical protein